jgi:hypothetical protein
MPGNAFLSELKKFFIDSFSDTVYQDGVLYFIIEELPNPRDSGVFKILCGSIQIALDAVTLDDTVLLLPISSLAFMPQQFVSTHIKKLGM